MNTQCPKCSSTETGPSFTFDWDKDDSGRVVAHNPFFVCVDCEHSWQVKMVLMVANPVDPEDSEALETFARKVTDLG